MKKKKKKEEEEEIFFFLLFIPLKKIILKFILFLINF